MTRIKVDPDQLRSTARKIRGAADRIDSVRSKVRSAYRKLDANDLSYRSRAKIETKVRRADKLGRKLESQINDLSRDLERIAERFRNADEQKLGSITKISAIVSEGLLSSHLPIAVGMAGVAGLNHIGHTAGEQFYDELYWVDTRELSSSIGSTAKLMGHSYKILRHFPYKDYKSVGRFINQVTGKKGWVGRMDKAGHIIKSPALKVGLKVGVPIVSGLAHFATDDDPDRVRAAGTAAVQTLIETGISANPVGGTVMAVNAGVQLYGNIVTSSTKLAGRMYGGEWEEVFYEQAYSLEDNFDRIDLSNITHDMAHVVVDGATEFFQSAGRLFSGKSTLADEMKNISTNFSKTSQSLKDLWGHVSDFPGGLFDTATDLVSTRLLHGAASIDKVVSVLPVPQEWKDTVHKTCLDTGRVLANADQTLGKGLIDFFRSDGMENITGVIHAGATA